MEKDNRENSNRCNAEPKVLLSQTNWNNLYFYKKSGVLYHLTYVFCQRFLPPHGDRTVDQMVQAARSGKQNIVEGLADGVTSTKMELKLLNVARASLQELREDFHDFLVARSLPVWVSGHARYKAMTAFCSKHNELDDYLPFFEKWDAEEMANIGLSLCHITDTMMNHYIKGKEKDFVELGGIQERMHAARTGYRKGQDGRLAELETAYAKLLKDYSELERKYLELKKRIEE